jgi:hypothetical protein
LVRGQPGGRAQRHRHATLSNEERLDDVIAGYGGDVDRDLVRSWWSWRCLVVVRWLFENGYGPPEQYPEVAVLRSLA